MAFELYKQLGDALKENLGQLLQDIPIGIKREQTLRQLSERLKVFAQARFDLFLQRLGDKESVPGKRISGEKILYPVEYAFCVLLDQIACDLDVIQRAIGQRQVEWLQPTLDRADKYAFHILQRAKDWNLLPCETTAITYFQKSHSVRVIPYAPVALVGIPFSCTRFDPDMMAVPHEIGHYVFWHGRKLLSGSSKPLRNDLDSHILQEPGWLYRWVEEIFADVYGCWASHPFIALDFQDLQQECSSYYFVRDDRVHPAPILRPYIYIQALALQGYAELAQDLKAEWGVRKAKFQVNDEIVFANGVCKRLDEILSPDVPTTSLSLTRLIDQIAGYFSSSTTEPVESVQDLARDWQGKLSKICNEQCEKDLNPPFSELDVHSPNISPEKDGWEKFISVNGWVTKGPDPNPKP